MEPAERSRLMTGSGKSTLLHAMAELAETDAGSVAIDDHHLGNFRMQNWAFRGGIQG